MSNTYIVKNPFSDNPVFTDVEAFFLGGIIISSDFQLSGDVMTSLVSYNSSPDMREKRESHRAKIKYLASMAGGVVRNRTDRRHERFDAIFARRGHSIDDLINAAELLRKTAGNSTKEAFLAGVFDGRSYLDAVRGRCSLAIDCPAEHRDEISELVQAFGSDLNIQININDARARREGGNDRMFQLRMSRADTEEFLTRIGLVSPERIERAQRQFEYQFIEEKRPDTLPALMTLTNQAPGSRLSQVIASNAPDEIHQSMIAAEESAFDRDDVDLPRGTVLKNDGPKAVPEIRSESNGRTTYRRSSCVRANAYENSGGCCEADGAHKTFARRVDGRPYLELHHLVPMSLQPFFEVSLDIEENMVALCSTCHRRIHYGLDSDELVVKLLNQRSDDLKRVGIVISADDLTAAYNNGYVGN